MTITEMDDQGKTDYFDRGYEQGHSKGKDDGYKSRNNEVSNLKYAITRKDDDIWDLENKVKNLESKVSRLENDIRQLEYEKRNLSASVRYDSWGG